MNKEKTLNKDEIIKIMEKEYEEKEKRIMSTTKVEEKQKEEALLPDSSTSSTGSILDGLQEEFDKVVNNLMENSYAQSEQSAEKSKSDEKCEDTLESDSAGAEVEKQENGEKISHTPDTEQLAVTKTPSELFNEARGAIIAKLKVAGIDVSNATHGAVKIATALDCGKELWLKAIKPRKSQLVYKIFEVDEDGMSDEMENDKTILAPYELERATTKVFEIIMNMQGYYGEDITDITTYISIIAKYRLLQPAVADSDVLSGPQIVKLLEKWFENHIVDPRVATFEMGGHVHVALVRRGEKTPYRIFNEIISEIAPANKPLAVKDWLYENDMLVHDENDMCRDTQKTLSRSIMEKIGVTSDKCISFNFSEEFRLSFYEEQLIEFDLWSLDDREEEY